VITDWSAGIPLMAGPILVGWTETSPETQGFWEGVARQELMIKRCASCSHYLHPRRIMCPDCRSDDLPWVRSIGTGTVYSYSTIYRAPTEEFQVPYTNGLVLLDEGVYMFGRIVGTEPECSIDDRVQVEFASVKPDGDPLPVYRVI
jgi:uncharacterized OB-fold protein